MSQPPSHNAKARKKLRVSHTCNADESETELKKGTERPSRKDKPSLHIELTHFRAELSYQDPPIYSDGIRSRAERRRPRPTPRACCRTCQSIPDRTHFAASVDVTGAANHCTRSRVGFTEVFGASCLRAWRYSSDSSFVSGKSESARDAFARCGMSRFRTSHNHYWRSFVKGYLSLFRVRGLIAE
jgi:hypothetical protein